MAESPQITLLHGNDEFAITAHIDKICAGLGASPEADMNIARFDGRTGIDYSALNSAVNAAPFMTSRRIMVLLNPVGALNPGENRKKFLDFLKNSQPTTTILLAEFDELKRENWLLKWAIQAAPRATVHIYNLPKRYEMPRWIESEVRKQGGKIEADAASRLAEMVGEDTRIAAQEVTKLLTYVNFERAANMADVDQVCAVTSQGSIFDLVDALGQGDGRKAQRTYHQMLENVDAFELWGMIIRQFRLLLQARELIDRNVQVQEIQKSLGLHEFVAQKVNIQAKRFSMQTLETIYHKLLEIDEGAKTSQVPLDLAIDTLIVEITKNS
jgi:DNA polymerase III subunit delta